MMPASRGVAQSGSALGWGPSGRRFKSCRPDQIPVIDMRRSLVVLCVRRQARAHSLRVKWPQVQILLVQAKRGHPTKFLWVLPALAPRMT